jgi:hypothetical protein
MKKGYILPSISLVRTRGIYVETHRLTGGIYVVRSSDRLSFHNIHAKFYKEWFRHSKIDGKRGAGIHRHTNSMKSYKPNLIFFPK